jgi:tRNA 2-thiocytidine biosynthesis protein TtcA
VSGLPKSELRVLESQLSRVMGRCIADFSLVGEGDRVMVCVSGGKDSYAMLSLLERYRRKAPFRFELLAVHLDQGQPGYDGAPLRQWLRQEGYPHRILSEDTYSVVMDNVPEGKTYCGLCSRLRRGILYNAAQELGCTRIALGHHRDDAIETLMLNMMFNGALAAMPPKLQSQDGRNVVIRPLMYAKESALSRYAELMGFPILPCDLCGSQDQLKRQQVKRLLGELETLAPQVKESMLGALGNVKASHLLDGELWRALGLSVATEGTGPSAREGANGAATGTANGARRRTAAGADGADAGAAAPRRLPLLG